MPTNFHLAPPPRGVDELTAVPIDIQHLAAEVVFDLATRQAQVTATMQFVLGDAEGCPIFDLRQTISSAVLDGSPLSVSQLAHHDFGGGADARLRVIATSLAAGSSHTLTLTYALAQPQSPNSEPIGWDPATPRLYWELWFSDLWAARYLEMWFPSNLIFDQFSFDLELRLDNTTISHAVFSNGEVTVLGSNHWRIQFPARFTALSPMLLVAAEDRIVSREGTATLPSSGTVSLTTCKLVGTPADLAAVEASVTGFLVANETAVGPYVHGDRFVTFVWTNPSRSMEYDGAITSNVGSIGHEVFHSWFARGVKPASQSDAWLDEGWTTYNDHGGTQIDPFDLSEPISTLAPANPYVRVTTSTSYSKGERFFAGLAATCGVANLHAYMRRIYDEHKTGLLTTAELEAALIRECGIVALADYFDHYVYGLAPVTGIDLSLRDDAADTGAGAWAGAFWSSPDVWVRNFDDDGLEHQDPELGQDNWFHARVRNRGTQTAGSFVVTFQVQAWAGTQFVYPQDFLPPIAVAVGRGLAPGESRVVKAKWPAARVPPEGTHGCVLVAAHTRQDDAPAGLHVWEHNNLAQRNVIVVDLVPGDAATIPFHLGRRFGAHAEPYRLEVQRPPSHADLRVMLSHDRPETLIRVFHSAETFVERPSPAEGAVRFLEPAVIAVDALARGERAVRLELAADSVLRLNPRPSVTISRSRDADLTSEAGRPVIAFRPGRVRGLPFVVPPRSELRLGVTVVAPRDAKPGDTIDVDLVQRDREQRIVGGITVRMRIAHR